MPKTSDQKLEARVTKVADELYTLVDEELASLEKLTSCPSQIMADVYNVAMYRHWQLKKLQRRLVKIVSDELKPQVGYI